MIISFARCMRAAGFFYFLVHSVFKGFHSKQKEVFLIIVLIALRN